MTQAARVPSTGNSPFAELPPIYTQLAEAKARKGLTFEQIAKEVGKDEVWIAAAFYGQAKLTPELIEALAKVLELPAVLLHNGLGAHWWPNRGVGPSPPTDPVIYRLYEGVLVYGHAIKAVIHEKFGDGIMSMINCDVTVKKKEDPAGDRVVLTFDGKFLPYSTW
ncbi:Cyanase [Fomitiporia mediterranea MF3/22]|uniref:Cyanase n=1 Tax=Fomitiporia mediterranea (strain MF3/22) TaxID=694068 RepID=UPI0004407D55|nr:Cyanase [Fomitiporia mediterranea MF3/22]EJD06389.1 Cyanase [Fomitiporia mediterranea MF3/22]